MAHQVVEIGGNKINLYSTTGEVHEAGKRSETHVSGGGTVGGSTPTNVHISSTTTVHDDIFIVDSAGKEHSFQLVDFDVAVRNGNRITITHAIREGKDSGPYFLVQNHSTSQQFFSDSALKKVVRPPVWLTLLIAIGGTAVLLPFLSCFAVVVLFGVLIGAEVVARSRVKTFKKTYDFSKLVTP